MFSAGAIASMVENDKKKKVSSKPINLGPASSAVAAFEKIYEKPKKKAIDLDESKDTSEDEEKPAEQKTPPTTPILLGVDIDDIIKAEGMLKTKGPSTGVLPAAGGQEEKKKVARKLFNCRYCDYNTEYHYNRNRHEVLVHGAARPPTPPSKKNPPLSTADVVKKTPKAKKRIRFGNQAGIAP